MIIMDGGGDDEDMEITMIAMSTLAEMLFKDLAL